MMQEMDTHIQVVIAILEAKGILTDEDIEFLDNIPLDTPLPFALELIKSGLNPNEM